MVCQIAGLKGSTRVHVHQLVCCSTSEGLNAIASSHPRQLAKFMPKSSSDVTCHANLLHIVSLNAQANPQVLSDTVQMAG